MELTNIDLLKQIEIILVCLIAISGITHITFIIPKMINLKAKEGASNKMAMAYELAQRVNLMRISALKYGLNNSANFEDISTERLSVLPTYQYDPNLSICSENNGQDFAITYRNLDPHSSSIILILQAGFWESITLNGQKVDQGKRTPVSVSEIKYSSNTIVFTSN
ncbi:hypothetical protein [Maridesulfovibrio salexigens]|uniref:Uncharacterized protein n=1 Tax=Maridesulfovibrio salexigens (strain ATCC 14822 / DSM 2638 / NCIMB 8403 / VKM B-1763) TaxID=526222 RepID=C6BT52_MARSD|nr:hypothetical protein [Maridesulfovibrio salexigens]ACS79756.1 hypothetical protein Desal_1694 [Maridesulfovibrio salexigens DSM 2638]